MGNCQNIDIRGLVLRPITAGRLQAPAVEQTKEKPSEWGRSGLRALKVGAAAVTGGALLAVTGTRLQGRAQGMADSTASMQNVSLLCFSALVHTLLGQADVVGWLAEGSARHVLT